MAENEKPPKDRPPAPKLEDLWEMDYEMRTMSEILKDWLPWRRKKRKHG